MELPILEISIASYSIRYNRNGMEKLYLNRVALSARRLVSIEAL
jgi:hypothetical protein